MRASEVSDLVLTREVGPDLEILEFMVGTSCQFYYRDKEGNYFEVNVRPIEPEEYPWEG